MEDRRNGTDHAMERKGPCNRTDRFTPFLGKRCHRATQMEWTVFRTFFRRVPYILLHVNMNLVGVFVHMHIIIMPGLAECAWVAK